MEALVRNPIRVQLSRKKGWRMPPNTVSVTRPGVFGNPFAADLTRSAEIGVGDAAHAVHLFRLLMAGDKIMLARHHPWAAQKRNAILSRLQDLRGKNLACWCRPGAACHADVLLELANSGLHRTEPAAGSGTVRGLVGISAADHRRGAARMKTCVHNKPNTCGCYARPTCPASHICFDCDDYEDNNAVTRSESRHD